MERARAADGISIVEGRLRVDAREAFATKRLAPQALRPVLEDEGEGRVRLTALPRSAQQVIHARAFHTINVVLLFATVVTTVWAGALHQGVNLLQEPSRFAAGLPYALALLTILGVHELGHYVVARGTASTSPCRTSTAAARWNDMAVGIAVGALALPRGQVRERCAGWDRLVV